MIVVLVKIGDSETEMYFMILTKYEYTDITTQANIILSILFVVEKAMKAQHIFNRGL